MTDFPLPTRRDEVLHFLETRRSNLAKLMSEPGPDANEQAQLLTIAARVPDHRKLAPWRFIRFEKDGRRRAGQIIADAYKAANPDHPEDRVQFEAQRFLRAPLVIGVVSSPQACPRGTPEWEQQLSAGAVCFNLCLAAQASGWGAQWLTEWYAYDAKVCTKFGLNRNESIAGFIYIGTATQKASKRSRPDVTSILSTF